MKDRRNFECGHTTQMKTEKSREVCILPINTRETAFNLGEMKEGDSLIRGCVRIFGQPLITSLAVWCV